MQRRAAAEGDHGAALGGLAALDGVHARGAGHVFLDDLADAGGRPVRIQAERRADARQNCVFCFLKIQLNCSASERHRVNAAQRDIGIRHRRLGAAAAVAGGAGLGARARRPDLDALQFIQARDRAATGADLHHLGHRHAQRQAAALQVAPDARHLELARLLRAAAADVADLGGGAAHVEGQHLGDAGFARDAGREDRAARRAGFHQAHREAARGLQRGEAAARGHQVQRAAEAAALQLRGEPRQVAGHERLHVGVGAGGGEALVLADFGADGGGERDGQAGQGGGEQFSSLLFMGIIYVGMQEADGDGFDVCAFYFFDQVAKTLEIERRFDLPLRGHPFRHRKAQLARHQRRRQLEVEVVVLVALLVAHLEHVAKALGGDERGARALALDQRVGGERGAVHQDADIPGGERRGGEHFRDSFEHSRLGRARRGQHLGRMAPAGVLQHDVGEGAADVGGEAGLGGSHGLAC